MRREATAIVSAMVFVVAGAASWAANASAPGLTASGKSGAVERVTVRNVDGERVGTVWMTQFNGRVSVSARLHSLTPGFHGFHIHQAGTCDPDAATGPFTTAGGHYNPAGEHHGEHPGDMPSLLVTDDGAAQLSFVTDRFTLAELRDRDGSAVMVHQGPDNFANIPGDRYSSDEGPVPDATTLATGDAGTRAACGVIDS